MTPLKKCRLSTIVFAALSIFFMVIIFIMSAQPVEKSSDISDDFSLFLLNILEPDLQKKDSETPSLSEDTEILNSETVPEKSDTETPQSPIPITPEISDTTDVTDKEDKTEIKDKEQDQESVTTSAEIKDKPKLKPTKNWFGIAPALFYPFIRKAAHFLLFMALGICLLLTFVSYYSKFDISQIILSVIVSFLYACSDEFHQLFVSGRGGGFNDIKIDFSGALFGIAIVCLIWTIGFLIKTFITKQKRHNKQKNA